MKRRLTLAAAALAAALLTACASAPIPADYAAEKPALDLATYFNGDLVAHGLFTDRSGKVQRRFTVAMKGTWTGDDGVLDEDFTYSDGKRERRVWRLKKLPDGRYTVSLQGEGEPMAHRDFWRMAERVTQLGKVPYTITNGSLMRHPQRLADAFEAIGVSIDTLDAVEAERIGRLRLPRVLKNLERLLAHMSAERVIVHTVDYDLSLIHI